MSGTKNRSELYYRANNTGAIGYRGATLFSYFLTETGLFSSSHDSAVSDAELV